LKVCSSSSAGGYDEQPTDLRNSVELPAAQSPELGIALIAE
jgi:hypothetical protein